MYQSTLYEGYLYSYPHKTAHRLLSPPVELTSLWAKEDRRALFLYLHVPFCEMRCGYCNLFSLARPPRSFVNAYLAALDRQVAATKQFIGDASFARLAIGGGTPTWLDGHQLECLFDLIDDLGVQTRDIPVSIELSPRTTTREKLEFLSQKGVDRLSIGVQSFVDDEMGSLLRVQRPEAAHQALSWARELQFRTLNVDLIYGIRGQTINSWLHSVQMTLEYQPEEIYLYPLYVRPLTGLGQASPWPDQRLDLYRAARDLLKSRGYSQFSMRMFRAPPSSGDLGPPYSCQDDGMVGLGCGARSYTKNLHYATEYAVGPKRVRTILERYLDSSEEQFLKANRGFWLDDEERRRRFVILSLLNCQGLNLADYQSRFGTDVLTDLPLLQSLIEQEDLRHVGHSLLLSEQGLERSDCIGPMLISRRVWALMDGEQD